VSARHGRNVALRLGGLRDIISVERVIIGAKQPRVSEKLRSIAAPSAILLGVGLMRRVNHLMDSIGARAIGQEYRDYTIVATVDGRIVGACMINTALGRDPMVWFLGPIAVLNSHRGKGIGTLLINEALRLVRTHKGRRIFLSVASDNRSAIALYQKCGFHKTETDTAMIYEYD